MFFYLLLNLEYKKERYANRREGDNRSYSFIPFVLSGPSGFKEKRDPAHSKVTLELTK